MGAIDDVGVDMLGVDVVVGLDEGRVDPEVTSSRLTAGVGIEADEVGRLRVIDGVGRVGVLEEEV